MAIAALQSLWNGSLTGKREQTVLTPYWLLDCLVCEWDGIACDATPDPDNRVPAKLHLNLDEGYDGLLCAWFDATFANPEYVDLKAWLDKAMREAACGFRIALLGPARGHRKWYRAAQRSARATGGIVQFDPFAFKGHKDKFPAPLELLCWNFRPTPYVWAGYGEVE